MYYDGWIDGCKVETCPWIDGSIYVNVAYYSPGQRISAGPCWEKSVRVTDNEKGRAILTQHLHSFVNFISNNEQIKTISETNALITF